ncbi:hypothetical protein LPN04_24445 [Rugamonas sp. A1-17]|nr:hypothetical protein [Rugamonas sp. A1-17]
MRSFATLARARPVYCEQPAPTPANWLATPAQCAWRGGLVMQRWVADASKMPSCVSTPAAWWHWRAAALAGPGGPAPWNAAWRRRTLAPDIEEENGVRRIVVLTQARDGGWVATEWRWTPPARAATRAWEQRRWEQLRREALAINDGDAGTATPSALQDVWRRNLRGRPGELDGAALVWQADHQCLRLVAANKQDEPDLPLPYAREDSRLEQRAAIQVQLTRVAPGATWPAPFRMMPPSLPQQRSATYAAIAHRGNLLVGRLWLPAGGEQPLLRARLEAPLVAPPGSAPEARAVTLLNREMAALAALWTADHER